MSDASRGNSERMRAEARRAGERFAELLRTRIPAPTAAEAGRRIRSKPGFFASLSDEARAAIRSFGGPEIIGPPRGR